MISSIYKYLHLHSRNLTISIFVSNNNKFKSSLQLMFLNLSMKGLPLRHNRKRIIIIGAQVYAGWKEDKPEDKQRVDI